MSRVSVRSYGDSSYFQEKSSSANQDEQPTVLLLLGWGGVSLRAPVPVLLDSFTILVPLVRSDSPGTLVLLPPSPPPPPPDPAGCNAFTPARPLLPPQNALMSFHLLLSNPFNLLYRRIPREV